MSTPLSAETVAQAAKAAFESVQVVLASERVRALSLMKAALEASKDKINLDVRLALYLRERTYI
jgi:gamma-glutamyl phosphate reductase